MRRHGLIDDPVTILVKTEIQVGYVEMKHPFIRILTLQALCLAHSARAEDLETYRAQVEPILVEYCYDCHGDGAKKGGRWMSLRRTRRCWEVTIIGGRF
ncbi:MAG: hypothetical protein ACI9DF_000163 [Verrucomicrobiales bacterium]